MPISPLSGTISPVCGVPNGTPTNPVNVIIKDVENNVFCDDTLNDGTAIVRFIRHYLYADDGMTVTSTYLTAMDGVTPYTVQGTEVSCDGQKQTEIVRICRCDDTNNGVPVQFISAYQVSVSNGVVDSVLPLGNFTDESLSTPYTLVGNDVDCNSIGATVTGVQAKSNLLAVAGNHDIDTLATSAYIIVKTVGDTLNPPQLVASNGVVDLIEGITYEFHAPSDGSVLVGPLAVNTNAGDVVIINETILTTV